jgi:2-amino-4-hydroxy-6-hydroxymethyldihydropteridine diphosphokinase
MRAGIALGSNLGDRFEALETARHAIEGLPMVAGPWKASRIYETDPVNSEPGAGQFLNAVIEGEYDGPPIVLLDRLQSIEALLGRPSKRPRNASRTIDIDLLYVGNLALNNDEVVIPHPRLHRRRFVLAPLNDIAPGLVLPNQSQPIRELLAGLDDAAGVSLFDRQWMQ